MIKRYEIISFEKQEEKINELISKFGGLPVGLSDEKWPISAGWQDRRMMFIGQLLIEKGVFENEKKIILTKNGIKRTSSLTWIIFAILLLEIPGALSPLCFNVISTLLSEMVISETLPVLIA